MFYLLSVCVFILYFCRMLPLSLKYTSQKCTYMCICLIILASAKWNIVLQKTTKIDLVILEQVNNHFYFHWLSQTCSRFGGSVVPKLKKSLAAPFHTFSTKNKLNCSLSLLHGLHQISSCFKVLTIFLLQYDRTIW